jgi:RNA polymerase sigma factor for flagellar operon FliA
MSAAIQALAEREQLILSLYYNDQLTFKEIGKVLDITESRVCQLHARAIINLKAIMKNE